jgi:hypothetical protein
MSTVVTESEAPVASMFAFVTAVHLVDVHLVGEQRDQERDRADQPVPQAQPESCGVAGVELHNVVRAGCARREGEYRPNQQSGPGHA